jgi:hypothetical protein
LISLCYVNKYNFQYWSHEPLQVYKKPLHSAKAFCGTTAFGIIRLHFFEETLHHHRVERAYADEIKATDGTLLQRVMDNF